MSFKRLLVGKYPTRQWAIYGKPGDGKSTFAGQMRGPILVVDADHRFQEVVRHISADVLALSDNPADHINAEKIRDLLIDGMKDAGVRTIVVDSLTSILSPLTVKAILDNEAGRNKNRVSAFRDKALAMRVLQDGITGWGTDTLWIYHARDGLDAQAVKKESTTVSPVELARLRRSLNMVLRVVWKGKKRGIHVEWSRRGRDDITLWDESESWVGMPERLEEAVYGGLSDEEMAALAKRKPASFSGPGAAIAWGYEQGCFNDAVHTEKAYNKLKAEKQPKSADEMWDLWIAEVDRRLAESSDRLADNAEHAEPTARLSDSAMIVTVEPPQEESGDYLFAAAPAVKRNRLVEFSGGGLAVVAPAEDGITPVAVGGDVHDALDGILEADENGWKDMDPTDLNPSPLVDFIYAAIVRATPDHCELSNRLINEPLAYIGGLERATIAQVSALSQKFNSELGWTGITHMDMTLGELVLRILSRTADGLPAKSVCVKLNNEFTRQDTRVKPAKDNPLFVQTTYDLIKSLGSIVKEMIDEPQKDGANPPAHHRVDAQVA